MKHQRQEASQTAMRRLKAWAALSKRNWEFYKASKNRLSAFKTWSYLVGQGLHKRA